MVFLSSFKSIIFEELIFCRNLFFSLSFKDQKFILFKAILFSWLTSLTVERSIINIRIKS